MKTIVFDLDGTICFPIKDHPHTLIRYGHAEPNFLVIEKMDELFENGYHIIIHTARRMVSHNGDINKIEQDVKRITELWLDCYDVKYHELIFGKPYSSTLYVDDKGCNVEQFLDMTIQDIDIERNL